MSLTTVDKSIPVLIVDDFAIMRRMVRNSLTQLGFKNITEAEDGAAALEKLKTERFELVISDLNMPDMTGIEILQAVRDSEQLKDIHFVLTATEAQRNDAIAATNAGASNYIVKPVTTEVLKQKLAAIFDSNDVR
jgi:two-component system chemotaxis response regulator CheY